MTITASGATFDTDRPLTSIRRIICLLVALAGAVAPTAQPADTLSPSATVSLLTMLPGDEVYSIFGHSSFRIHDPATGLDRTYNYGTFDFEQPGFVLRFVRGRLDYILDTAPFDYEVARYEWLRRPMIEQRLALDAETVAALHRRLEINALPENRAYRYLFFHDNCSTRLLAMLDSALTDAGRPRIALPAREESESFRDLIRPYAAGDPLLWVGMSAGLGTPADAVATTRQRSFLPLELMRLFDVSSVEGRSLVARRDTVFWIAGAGAPARSIPWPAILGWSLFAAGLAGTVATRRGRPAEGGPSRAMRLLDIALLGFSGVLGIVVAFLWFATEHGVTGPNLHLAWAWPTHLAAAVVVARGRHWRAYFLAAGAFAALVVLGWPFWPQDMPDALLPVVALLAVRAGARALASQRVRNREPAAGIAARAHSS